MDLWMIEWDKEFQGYNPSQYLYGGHDAIHDWETQQLLPKVTSIKKSNNFPTEEYVSCLI